jgi:hypothetical protein
MSPWIDSRARRKRVSFNGAGSEEHSTATACALGWRRRWALRSRCPVDATLLGARQARQKGRRQPAGVGDIDLVRGTSRSGCRHFQYSLAHHIQAHTDRASLLEVSMGGPLSGYASIPARNEEELCSRYANPGQRGGGFSNSAERMSGLTRCLVRGVGAPAAAGSANPCGAP